jgi:hypothetical protein
MRQINKPPERHPSEPACTERSERALLVQSAAEVEPPCARERSKSRRACPERSRRMKSRAQPRDRDRSRKTWPERAEKHPFLIATRTYSREKSTHCKQKVIAISNRHKIHFYTEPACRTGRRSGCVLFLLHPGGDGAADRMPSDECRVLRKFLPHPVLSEVEGPKLNANRGYAELAMALSRCKQRTTLLSNRGEMRVVHHRPEGIRTSDREVRCQRHL